MSLVTRIINLPLESIVWGLFCSGKTGLVALGEDNGKYVLWLQMTTYPSFNVTGNMLRTRGKHTAGVIVKISRIPHRTSHNFHVWLHVYHRYARICLSRNTWFPISSPHWRTAYSWRVLCSSENLRCHCHHWFTIGRTCLSH